MTEPRKPIPGVISHPKEVIQKFSDAGVLKDVSIGGGLSRAFSKWSERTAIVSPEGRLTYAELNQLTNQAAAAFLALGLKPLDRVIFQLGNTQELFISLYGCFKAGLIPVCTLPSHRELEIGYIANHVKARAHIVQGDAKFDLVSFAKSMAGKVPSMQTLVVARSTTTTCGYNLDALIADQDPSAAADIVSDLQVDAWNAGIFHLSGGTTGIPKVIPRFHSEYVYQMYEWAKMSGLDETTVVYWPLPATHNAAMACFNTPTHLLGGTVCVQESIHPEDFLGMIEREGVTFTGAALPIIIRAIDSGLVGNYDLSSVNCFISLGETPLVERDLGVPGNHIFGMAEGTLMRTLDSDPVEIREMGIGRPISPYDEIRIVEIGTDKDVEPGKIGEFLARGPYTIRGYFDSLDLNKEKFTDDGFYRTGDLMREHIIDDCAYYSFEGRTKDNIDRGMEKINAGEVERGVQMHPAVKECMVIGMPDRKYGERVCAYIIPEEGETPPGISELCNFIVSIGMAKFKSPERVEVVKNFPVTKLGKTSKELLRQDIEAKLKAEAETDG